MIARGNGSYFRLWEILSINRRDDRRRVEAKAVARSKLDKSNRLVQRAVSSRDRVIEELDTFESISEAIRDIDSEDSECSENTS